MFKVINLNTPQKTNLVNILRSQPSASWIYWNKNWGYWGYPPMWNKFTILAMLTNPSLPTMGFLKGELITASYPPWNWQQKHLKMNGWNTIDSFGARPIFRGRSMLVLYFREGNFWDMFFSSLPSSSNCFPSRFPRPCNPSLTCSLPPLVFFRCANMAKSRHNYTRGRTTMTLSRTVMYGLSMLIRKNKT